MAVILGNMLQKKEEREMSIQNEKDSKYSTLMDLTEQAEEKLVPLATDIYDTYWYIRNSDVRFASNLWDYLKSDRSAIKTSSFFVFKSERYNEKVGVSRFGLCVLHGLDGHYVVTDNPKWDCNNYDENTFLGKYTLKKYMEENRNNMKISYLDYCIKELEALIYKFPIFAKGFFDMVSNYEIK